MKNGGIITFPNNLSGNDYNAFTGTTGIFKAPISGRYTFGLFLVIGGGETKDEYNYNIDLKRNGSQVHWIYTSGTRSSKSEFDRRYFKADVQLDSGDTIYFDVMGHSAGLTIDWSSTIEGYLVQT